MLIGGVPGRLYAALEVAPRECVDANRLLDGGDVSSAQYHRRRIRPFASCVGAGKVRHGGTEARRRGGAEQQRTIPKKAFSLGLDP